MRENAMLLIYIGAYTHKYIGHEIANWWGLGVVGALDLAVIGGNISVRQGRDPALRWISIMFGIL